VRDIESSGERNRGIYVLKSRGMAHSNQIREFLLTDHGVELRDVYVGASGVLTGSARLAQEAQEKVTRAMVEQEGERRRIEIDSRRLAMEAQITAMRAALQVQEAETLRSLGQASARELQLISERVEMGLSRQADATVAAG